MRAFARDARPLQGGRAAVCDDVDVADADRPDVRALAVVLRRYLAKHHRELLLARYGIACSGEEARRINLRQRRGPLPATRAKYKDAIEACGTMDFIELNLSQIARRFGLDGTGLARQLRTHYPEILEFREQERLRLGLDDHLQRGTRRSCREQYARAVELLRGDRYITVQEAADSCGVSYAGLEQHLLFYHKELVGKRIRIREKAVKQQCKGEITGRGTRHVPSRAMKEKYAEAVRLYRTGTMSAAQIAAKAQVPKKGFYEYMRRWHMDLICRRKNIPYEEGRPVDFSKVRKYNPATRAKYADAIQKLKDTGLPTAQVAAEYDLQPEALRGYLKEHEPELYARQGMLTTDGGRAMSRRSMERYEEPVRLYATTPESLKSLARRFGLNDCALRGFIKRHFPESMEQHRQQCVASDSHPPYGGQK